MNDPTIQQAIQDLALIRRAIEQGAPNENKLPSGTAANAQLLAQSISMGLCLALVIYELTMDLNMAWILNLSRFDRELGWMGLGEVAMCIPFLVAGLYFIVWRSAKHSERTLTDYLRRNFHYLRNLNFLSDLFVKFIVLALAVLSGHGEWVPSLLLLFIGDFLLQGRFFTIPIALSLVLGPICFAGAGVLYIQASTQLLWPLLVFAGLNGVSLASVYLRRSV